MITVPMWKQSHVYSAIAGLQKTYTVRYIVYTQPKGSLLRLERQEEDSVEAESWYCPYLGGFDAVRLLQYAYENSLGLGSWVDLLDNFGVERRAFDKPLVPE